MISVWWRERLTYLAMSLIVGWHAFATIIAPAPADSVLIQSFRFLVQPYLSLFRLDNHWNFFAPSVGRHSQFRYVIEDEAGKRHVFIPVDELDSIPRYVMWREFKYFFDEVMEAPEARGEPLAELLCQKHVSLKPASISLLQVRELDYGPEDYLQGYGILDPDFVTVNTFARLDCRDGSPMPVRPPAGLRIRR